jgi:hypothetical protein
LLTGQSPEAVQLGSRQPSEYCTFPRGQQSCPKALIIGKGPRVRDDNAVTRLLPAAARNPPPKRSPRHETQRRFDPDDLLLASQQLTEVGWILLRMLHGIHIGETPIPQPRHLTACGKPTMKSPSCGQLFASTPVTW